MKGSAFRLAGLILGIVASVAAVVAIVLSAVGMSKAPSANSANWEAA